MFSSLNFWFSQAFAPLGIGKNDYNSEREKLGESELQRAGLPVAAHKMDAELGGVRGRVVLERHRCVPTQLAAAERSLQEEQWHVHMLN